VRCSGWLRSSKSDQGEHAQALWATNGKQAFDADPAVPREQIVEVRRLRLTERLARFMRQASCTMFATAAMRRRDCRKVYPLNQRQVFVIHPQIDKRVSSDLRPAAVLMGKADLSVDGRHRLAQVVLKPVDIDLAARRKANFLGSWQQRAQGFRSPGVKRRIGAAARWSLRKRRGNSSPAL
jgi:hypothetical protein